MARPPPSNDAEPDLIEFGIPVLDDRIQSAELDFPATRAEVIEALGEQSVPYDANGNAVAVATAVEAIDVEEFESRHELLDALHPVFEGYRQRTTLGFFGRLRQLLPF